jgi:hypothetical protein
MQKSLLIFNIFCLSVVSFAQSPVALIPYCKGNLWGFSDISGTRKIPALYERVSLFSSDYSRKENKIIYCAIVVKNGNYGVIDENNNFLIQPDFKSIEEEYLGENLKLFIIKDKYNNYGLSGLSQIILQPAYDSISRVESDYFLLRNNGKLGIANVNGDIIVPVAQDQIKQLSETKNEVEWKAVNTSETKIIKALRIRRPSDNGEILVAGPDAISLENSDEKKYDYDKELAVLKSKYAVYCQGYDKNLCYCMKDGKTGFANISNNKRVPPIYDKVQVGYVSFSENLLIVKLNGMYGLTDEDGKILVPVKYKYISVSPYKTGVFNIESFNGQYGFFFPSTGKFIAPKYSKVTAGESVYTNKQQYKDFNIMYVSDGKSSFYVGENGIEFKE